MSKRITRGDSNTIKQLNRATQEIKSRFRNQEVAYKQAPLSPKTYIVSEQKMKYSDIYRNTSESKIGNRQEYYKSNIVKRRNESMVSNLKSQLQTLKLEVSRLVNKQPDQRYSSLRPSFIGSQADSHQQKLSLGDYGKEVSDSVSMTSQKVIGQPLRRLQKQFDSNNFDHTHYLQLQNDLLKTELRNLKNKYNIVKQQWREKYYALQTKNQYLEMSLKKSDHNLKQCQKQLEQQVQAIKFQLSRQSQNQNQQSKSRVSLERHQTENQYVQEKMKKLYEELSEKNKKINMKNVECNQLQTELQKQKIELRNINQHYSQHIRQLELAQHEKQINNSHIQQEILKKKQMQKMIDTLKQRNNVLAQELSVKNTNNSNKEDKVLDKKYDETIKQYQAEEKKLRQKINDMNSQINKAKQLNKTLQEEIVQLKKSIQNSNSQTEQVSSTLRQQRQKSSVREAEYRKLIDDTKESYDKEILMLKQELENLRENNKNFQLEKDDVESKAQIDMKQKERHINKWKAEYKLLKSKYDELEELEKNKIKEMEDYYRNYKTYESQNKQLQMRNNLLESIERQNVQKIKQVQKKDIQARVKAQEEKKELQIKNIELERKIQQLSSNLEEISLKFSRQTEELDKQRQYKKQGIKDWLSSQNSSHDSLLIERQLEQQDNKLNKYVKQIRNKETMINKLKKQVRNLLENQDKQIEQLRKKQVDDSIKKILIDYEQTIINLRKQSQDKLIVEREAKQDLLQQNIVLKNKIGELQMSIVNISQDCKRITLLYNQKSEELICENQKNQYQRQQLENKLYEVQHLKNEHIKNLHSELTSKQDQIIQLRAQNRRIYSLKNDQQHLPFDQVLKNQIETVDKLRQEQQKKNEQIYRIRDILNSKKSELDNLKSQYDILRLKFISEKKNLEISYGMQIQQLKNLHTVQQKKVALMQQKIKLVIDENKKKDSFIQNYIMAKKLPANEKQMVSHFLKEFQIHVTGRNINEKLEGEIQQLQRLIKYNSNLMKEIGQLKQKLTLYEAVSVSFENEDMHQSIQFATPHKRINKMKSLMGSVQ